MRTNMCRCERCKASGVKGEGQFIVGMSATVRQWVNGSETPGEFLLCSSCYKMFVKWLEHGPNASVPRMPKDMVR